MGDWVYIWHVMWWYCCFCILFFFRNLKTTIAAWTQFVFVANRRLRINLFQVSFLDKMTYIVGIRRARSIFMQNCVSLLPFCEELLTGHFCSISKTTNVIRIRAFYVQFSQWELPECWKHIKILWVPNCTSPFFQCHTVLSLAFSLIYI